MSDLPPRPPEMPTGPPVAGDPANPPPPAPPLAAPPFGPDEDPFQPSGRRHTVPVVAAVLGVLVLLIATIGFATRDDDGGDRPADGAAEQSDDPAALPSTSIPGSTAPSTTAPEIPTDEFLALVDELSAFVADARGLAFIEPVDVELLPDAEFNARLLEDFEDNAEDLDDLEVIYRALGVLTDERTMRDLISGILSVGVVGVYKPDDDQLLVRGHQATPYVQSTIVHELVHALDDQHFDLDRNDEYEERLDEIATGFSAVVEGNAVRIEDAWKGAQTTAFRAEIAQEEADYGAAIMGDLLTFPPILLYQIAAPYQFGPTLIDELLDVDGEQAVNDALLAPPDTSEQILDPDLYLAGEERIPVTAPEADGPVVIEGVVGALFWKSLFEAGGERVPGSEAAVDGWGGDWGVAWQDGEANCVRADVIGDTVADTDEFETSLRAWAEDRPWVMVTRRGEYVRLDSCTAPGGAPSQV